MLYKTGIILVIFCTGLVPLASAHDLAPFESATGLGWYVVDDPYINEPSNWITTEDLKLTQTENCFRSDNEYDYYTGTMVIAAGINQPDLSTEARVASDDDDGWGEMIRLVDENNYYRFITVKDSSNGGPFQRLEKFVDGTRYVLDETSNSFEVGTWYTLRMEVIGDQISVYLDGNQILSATDDTIKGENWSTFGFFTYANPGFYVTDVSVR